MRPGLESSLQRRKTVIRLKGATETRNEFPAKPPDLIQGLLPDPFEKARVFGVNPLHQRRRKLYHEGVLALSTAPTAPCRNARSLPTALSPGPSPTPLLGRPAQDVLGAGLVARWQGAVDNHG